MADVHRTVTTLRAREPDETSRVCPLCGIEDVSIEKSFSRAWLERLYHDYLSTSVAAYLPPTIEEWTCHGCGLVFYLPVSEGPPELYESLGRKGWYYQAEKPEFEYAAAVLNRSTSVLEVGAGPGSFRSYLDPAVRYVGLDFNPAAVSAAQRAGVEVVGESIDVHAARLPGQYDAVCAFQVLEHVAQPAVFVRSCRRALKDGGLMVFSVPNGSGFLGADAQNPLDYPPHHMTRWNEEVPARLAAREGLELVDVHAEPMGSHFPTWAGLMVREVLAPLVGTRASRFSQRAAAGIADRLPARLRPSDLLLPAGHSMTMVFRAPSSS